MSKNQTAILILAAGKGVRMQSEIPKVLHKIGDKTFIRRVLDATEDQGVPIIVVGCDHDQIVKEIGDVRYVVQEEPLGTGHAVGCAKDTCQKIGCNEVVVLMGDHPLITRAVVQNIEALHESEQATITMGTVVIPEDADGLLKQFENFGRVIRNENGDIERIVEVKDATEEEKAIREVNLNYFCFNAKWLWANVGSITTDNASEEFYITDLVGFAKQQGEKVVGYTLDDPVAGIGINTSEQLEEAKKLI